MEETDGLSWNKVLKSLTRETNLKLSICTKLCVPDTWILNSLNKIKKTLDFTILPKDGTKFGWNKLSSFEEVI